jgi:ribosomal protein L7Ae-like RNA K-turn-binding protein
MSDVLGLLGLGLRAGNVIVGVDGVRTGLRAGQCALIVVAADASPRALEKVVRLAEGRGIPSVVGPRASDIGQRLGRPPVMVVGVCDPALARGIRAAGNKADVGTED